MELQIGSAKADIKKNKMNIFRSPIITAAGLLLSYAGFAQNTFPATGNVGIGTTSPAGALAVNWSANTNGLGPIIHNSNTGSTALTDITFLNDANQFGNITFSSSNYYAPGLTRPNTFGMSTSAPGGLVFLSTAAGAPITFQSTSVITSSTIPAITIKDGGNVGIGTSTPSARLEVDWSANTFGVGNVLHNSSNGTSAATDLTFYNDLNQYGALAIASSTYVSGGLTRPSAFGLSTSSPGGLNFLSTAAGAPITFQFSTGSPSLTLKDNGYVGIGSSNPDAMLTVNGTIHAKEVKVDLSVPGPDYVFEDGYRLTPLPVVKQFIKDNKHLSEIPAAKELEKDGVNLSEMNMALLKKVEELTLYVIQQNDRINDLEKRLQAIKK